MIGISYGLDIDVILEHLIQSVRIHHRLPKADEGLFCWLERQGQQQKEGNLGIRDRELQDIYGPLAK